MSTSFAGADGLLRQDVSARLDQAGRDGMDVEELRRQRTAGPGELESVLARLQAEGQAVDMDGRWVAARHTGWTVGLVEKLEEGDALIRPGVRGEPSFFVKKRNLKRAQAGDRVLVRPLGNPRPSDGRLAEATVVKILGPGYESLVGSLETDERGLRWLVPFDSRVPLELHVEGAGGIPDGHFVVVAVERPGRAPVGRVAEVLGDPEKPGVDVLVVLRHYGIPEDFPAEVLERAGKFPADPGPADWLGREDLRDRVIITIDGETARDFDDAVSIERLPDGVFRLGVHIADVSHYVKDGDALDLEGYRRGTSVYYPDRAIPMLPEGLSNGLCSLRPDVPRLTLSAFLEIDRDGVVRERRFSETVIRSSRRMTYTEVRRLLEEPRAEDAAEYGPVLPVLREMHHLMQILNHARSLRGSIDFDLPEGDVVLNTDGMMVGVFPEERNVAHRIVEEFMVAANEAVAYELVRREVPALFRVHAQPTLERLEDLAELLATFGLKLRGDLENLPPAALQEVLREVKGKPEEKFVSSVVLRTLQRALYDPRCLGHYALASEFYTHFTSPIRRYPDLVVHRQLKALLRGKAEKETARTHLAERLPAMAEHTSTTERRAEQSERDLLQWKKVRFLAGRVGETFKGRITGVQPFGLFVQIDGYFVDGLVPVRTMGDDFYRYEPEAHRLVGEHKGRVFRLADAVEIVLAGASQKARGLDFTLVGMPAPGARFEKPRAAASKPRPKKPAERRPRR